MKKALITGLTGQDGSYLAELLLSKGYEVIGMVRRTSNDPFVRFPEDVRKKVKVEYGNMRDRKVIERILRKYKPDEIYNLAAMSDVRISFDCPEETFEINYRGVGNLMNAVRKVTPSAKVYQASTSEMFGKTKPPQNERSRFQPVSPYGESKVKAHEEFIKAYRTKYKLFAVSGILFNHESPRRGAHFVTRKISLCLSKIKLGLIDSFELGNLDSERDWGYAGDYVEAMWRMLQYKKPEDFVIATGISHSVREFLIAAAKALDMKLVFEGEMVMPHAHTVCVDPATHLVYFPLENLDGHPILRIMAPASP